LWGGGTGIGDAVAVHERSRSGATQLSADQAATTPGPTRRVTRRTPGGKDFGVSRKQK